MILPPDIEDRDPDQAAHKTFALTQDGISLGVVTVDFESRCWKLGGMSRIHQGELNARWLSRGEAGWKQRLVDEAIAGLRESAR